MDGLVTSSKIGWMIKLGCFFGLKWKNGYMQTVSAKKMGSGDVKRENEIEVKKKHEQAYPIPSVHGIFTCMWLLSLVNVGKYTTRGWYGYANMNIFCENPHNFSFMHSSCRWKYSENAHGSWGGLDRMMWSLLISIWSLMIFGPVAV